MPVVTALATETRLVVGQQAVGPGENEIVAARALLGCLDLTGSLVTADALFSSRRHAGEFVMPGLATLARVEAKTEREGRSTRSVRYHLSSAILTPERFGQAIRAHRAIENGLRRVLDTTFDGDRARNRRDHGPQTLAVIRKLALNVLQTARPDISIRSIRRKRKRSAGSDAFARSIIGQMR